MRLLLFILIVASVGGYMYHDKKEKEAAAAAAVAAAEEKREQDAEAARQATAQAQKSRTGLQSASMLAPQNQPAKNQQMQNTGPKPLTNSTDIRKQWGWDTASPLDPPKPGQGAHGRGH